MSNQKILTKHEVVVIQMALSAMIQDIDSVGKDQSIPFDPKSRREMQDILSNAKSALAKVSHTSGGLIQLDPYKEGDENKFLTKQS